MVPANRLGYSQFTQASSRPFRIITLTLFAFFSVYYLKEEFRWN